ncbi:MAG: hypothetical protein RMJ54_10495 [Roseiflexaceae bacterium]|nr:hypothetical protein [Roseiflexaceae bacterium]MDW8233199.1 hypothetical protein [Roseiflexaceae bacterium]
MESDHLVCYDERGVAFGDDATVVRQAAEAEVRAQRESERAPAQSQRASLPRTNARCETQARGCVCAPSKKNCADGGTEHNRGDPTQAVRRRAAE